MNRAERRRRTQNSVLAQLRIARQGLPDPRMLMQPGRLKKRHALDCGRPRCALCGNPRRNAGAELTIQEIRQRREHREGLALLAGSNRLSGRVSCRIAA
ncbi:MAG: hypothetical protein ABI434_02810 [Burkholderiaceae bacterium]